MENIVLSKYFSTKYDTNIIRGKITTEQLQNLMAVCGQLDIVREHFAMPIKVTSGFRDEAYNKQVGGAKNSQHKEGYAIDFQMKDNSIIAQVFKWIVKNMEFDQVILEYKNTFWIHFSYVKGKNRKQAMTAKLVNGKMEYKPYLTP